MRHPLLLTLAVILAAAVPRRAPACTTFATGTGQNTLVGKSYDFDAGDGLLMVNKRGVAKQAALPPGTSGQPARWISRFGSLTFNQFGRELPLGGMNERGLVVEIMWLSQTRLPGLVADHPTVNELQWIQHLLDQAATVPEAVAAAEKLQVAKVYGAVHYLACDRSGACASLEYLDGKLVVHQGRRMPARVLTNSSYAESLKQLRRHAGFGGRAPLPSSESSLDRFVRAATHARPQKAYSVAIAFDILERVRMASLTQWQIVYQPALGLVHFRNAGEKEHTTLDLASQELDCGTPVRVLDLRGTVTKRGSLVEYSGALNLKLLKLSLRAIRLSLPEPVVHALAAYPEQGTRCQASAGPR